MEQVETSHEALPPVSDLLFEVITRRYEQKSLVLTTNLPFGEWVNVFPNASSAVALVDRLIHHSDIIPIEGTQLPPP